MAGLRIKEMPQRGLMVDGLVQDVDDMRSMGMAWFNGQTPYKKSDDLLKPSSLFEFLRDSWGE